MNQSEEKKIDKSKMTISEEVVINIEQMNKWFGHFHVLRDINLTVHKGERIVICGPSGSGKSTLIRCINRLEEHQKGLMEVQGIELTDDIKRIDKIRKEKKHYAVDSDESLEIPIPSKQEDEILASELSKKINNILKFLPKEQAELLKLSYFYEKTHTDIANDLNIPLGTVKSRIRLALSKMKNLVKLN